MKNKLIDLNNHLFAQLERLGDEDITDDKLAEEINRAKAITNIAQQIVNNGNLALNAAKFKEEYLPSTKALPDVFTGMITPESSTDRKQIPGKLKTEFGQS